MKTVVSNMITLSTLAGIGAAIYLDSQDFYAEKECLAMNIYHEARGEPIQGQIAVANVTMNRVAHDYFPDTVCEVVWQPHQFSWTSDGRSDATNDQEAYDIALNIAEWVLAGEEEDNTEGALFYHTHAVNPSWNRQMELAMVIGVHRFYQWDGTWQ